MVEQSYIWAPEAGWERLTVVAFRRVVELEALPTTAELCCFAHSHYRLHVNGVPVAGGPYRSPLHEPAYDRIDLLPWLRPGRNVIAVMVAHCGGPSFHHQPAPGCFVAWGAIDAIDLSTASSWRCKRSRGHAADVPRWSFAIPATEICDERTWPADWDQPTVDDAAWVEPLRLAGVPWGPLRDAAMPQLTQEPRAPMALLRADLHRQDERIYGFRLIADGPDCVPLNGQTAIAATWIHSETARNVDLGTWWGEHGCNGEALVQEPELPGRPMRTDCRLALEAGWNLLVIRYGLTAGCWPCQIALPADLRVDASRGEAAEPIAFRCAPADETAAVDARWTGFPRDAAGLAALSSTWIDQPITAVPTSPLRHLAWAESAVSMPAVLPCRFPAGRPGSVVCDFGRVCLGRVRVRLQAPPGTVVDLAYAEEARDGRPYYHKNVVTTAADRRIVGASGELVTFFRRGFRILEVGVAGHDQEVVINDISLIEERYPYAAEGDFACSDPRLTQLWAYGRETLRNCSEDVITDCPWRERTMYGGDLFIETAVTAVLSSDLRLVRRSLAVYLACANEDGGVGGRAPAAAAPMAGGAEEFQLMVLLTACWYHRLSGDDEQLRAWLPRLRAIAAVFADLDPSGCYRWRRSFIDHGRVTRQGLVCAANAVLHGALQALEQSCRLLGEDAADYGERAARIAAGIERELWDPTAAAYRSSDTLDPEEHETHHLHASYHAGLWGVADGAHDQAVADTIRARLAALANDDSLRRDTYHGRQDLAFSAYGSSYLLMYCGRMGAADIAEEVMRTFFADMLDHPSGTIWEHFNSSKSLCHAWAAGPVWYASTQVLGVLMGPDPTLPRDQIIVAPMAEHIDWAAGTVPHPLGPVTVRWAVRGDCLEVSVEAPAGVPVQVRPRGRLAALRLLRCDG